MRVKLAIGSVAGLAVAGFGLAVLLFIGGPVASPAGFSIALVVTLLGLIGGLITGVFAIILPLFGRSLSPADLADAIASGRQCFARVREARATGSQLNGAYVYEVDLVVGDSRVPAYRCRDRIRIQRREGVLRGGEVITVVRLRDDGPHVVAVAGPSRTPQDAPVPQDAPPWP